jgi:hypothetical protein
MDQEQFSAELTHVQLICDHASTCSSPAIAWEIAGGCQKQWGEKFGTATQRAWRSVLAVVVGTDYRDGLAEKDHNHEQS